MATARLVRGAGEDHVLMFTRHASGELSEEESELPLVYSDYINLGELDVLSPRELEVLCLIGQGLATKEIAQVLERSPRTVDVHRRAITLKLGETRAVKLAQLAAEAGLVATDSRRVRLESPGPASKSTPKDRRGR